MSNSFHVSQVSRGQAFAILGGAALMMTLAMGIRQNLGLFQAPASKELGIAISDFALAISVQQVAWGSASHSPASSPTSTARAASPCSAACCSSPAWC